MVVADLTLDLPLPRGILVGLAAAIKVTPIILIPYLFLTRQGRAGVRAIATFCAAAAAGGRRQRLDLVGLLDALHPRPAAGRACCRGSATRASLGALERMIGHTREHAHDVRDRADRGGLGLAVAAGAYRRSSPRPRAPRRGGHRVAGQPGVVVAPLHLGGPARGLAGPGARTGPATASGTRSASPCSSGPRRTGGCRTGRASSSPGGAGSSRSATPTSCSSSGWSSGRRSGSCARTLVRPLRLGRRAMAPSGAGS